MSVIGASEFFRVRFRDLARGACCLVACGVIYAGAAAAKEVDQLEKVREIYMHGNFYMEQKDFEEAQKQYLQALRVLYGPDFKSANPAQDLALVLGGEATDSPSDDENKGRKESAARPEPGVKRASSGAAEYVIGMDDVLCVSVWQNPDLSQDLIVRPDGKASFPLIGDVDAAGRTIPELSKDVVERLKEFVRMPQVTMSLKKIGGQRVMVLGEVASQGVVSVTGSRTVMEAIALAGGFTRDSVPSSTILIRGGFDNPQAQRLNLSKALKGQPIQNIVLQAEDIVFVPKKFIANVNYFLSQVLDPISKGAYTAEQLQGYH